MALDWTTLGILGGAVVPLLALPLAMLSQYFKGLHEYHVKRGDDLLARLNRLADDVNHLASLVRDFEKQYTARDDWLRESTRTHAQLDKLADMILKLQLELKNGNGATKKLVEALKKSGSSP